MLKALILLPLICIPAFAETQHIIQEEPNKTDLYLTKLEQQKIENELIDERIAQKVKRLRLNAIEREAHIERQREKIFTEGKLAFTIEEIFNSLEVRRESHTFAIEVEGNCTLIGSATYDRDYEKFNAIIESRQCELFADEYFALVTTGDELGLKGTCTDKYVNDAGREVCLGYKVEAGTTVKIHGKLTEN